MASRPASSPCEPALGWIETRVVAGHLGEPALELVDQLGVARGVLGRRERVQVGEARQQIGSISAVALSFIVQEPSGIMPRSSA